MSSTQAPLVTFVLGMLVGAVALTVAAAHRDLTWATYDVGSGHYVSLVRRTSECREVQRQLADNARVILKSPSGQELRVYALDCSR